MTGLENSADGLWLPALLPFCLLALLLCGDACYALDDLPTRPAPELGDVVEIGERCTLQSRCASWAGAPGVCALVRTGPGSFVERCALACADTASCPAGMACQEALCVDTLAD